MSTTYNLVSHYSNFVPRSPVEELPLNEHALIGVSPFNSYFSQENIEKMICWALKNFANINIFIPDEIYQYTFQALGYTQEKARRKAKKQDNYLINKVVKAFLPYDFSYEEIQKKIILLSQLKNQKEYLEIYDNCLDLFENDQYFREGCISTSEWVLKGKGISDKLVDDNITEIAVKYFLSELPLFIDTPHILNISSSMFVYKDMPKFLKSIYSERVFIASNQGFLKLEVHN